MEGRRPPCSLRNTVEAARGPTSPRKGSASVSPTHPGAGRVSPGEGWGWISGPAPGLLVK